MGTGKGRSRGKAGLATLVPVPTPSTLVHALVDARLFTRFTISLYGNENNVKREMGGPLVAKHESQARLAGDDLVVLLPAERLVGLGLRVEHEERVLDLAGVHALVAQGDLCIVITPRPSPMSDVRIQRDPKWRCTQAGPFLAVRSTRRARELHTCRAFSRCRIKRAPTWRCTQAGRFLAVRSTRLARELHTCRAFSRRRINPPWCPSFFPHPLPFVFPAPAAFCFPRFPRTRCPSFSQFSPHPLPRAPPSLSIPLLLWCLKVPVISILRPSTPRQGRRFISSPRP